jgi:CRP-like cAMP-binding protein
VMDMLDIVHFGREGKTDQQSCRNLLLRCLPTSDRSRLAPHFERVALIPGRVLQYPNTAMTDVYFIEQGLVSGLADSGHGKSVETWLIGPEGLVGIRVVLGKRESAHGRIVQIGGSALRVPAEAFAALVDTNKLFRQVMLQYVHTVMVQSSQLSACNTHHDIQQRLARWLLMAQDRCETDTLSITHKMLARLLGVRRATVGECAAALEAQGILGQSRSVIRILDRCRLKSIACKCYDVIHGADKELRAFCESKRKA